MKVTTTLRKPKPFKRSFLTFLKQGKNNQPNDMRWACTRTRISDCILGLRRWGDTEGQRKPRLEVTVPMGLARRGWDFIPGMGFGEETLCQLWWYGVAEERLVYIFTTQISRFLPSRAKVALQTSGSNFLKEFWCLLGPEFELYQTYFYLRYFYSPYLDFLRLCCCTTLFWTLLPLLGFGSSNS